MRKSVINMKTIAASAVLISLSLGVFAQARGGQGEIRLRGPITPGTDMGIAMLDLTGDQKEEIKTIRLATLKAVQPLKDELKINDAKIKAQINNDDPDKNEIVHLVEANAKLTTQIQIKEIEKIIKLRSLLDEEQKVLFDAYHDKAGKNRQLAELHSYRAFRRPANAQGKGRF